MMKSISLEDFTILVDSILTILKNRCEVERVMKIKKIALNESCELLITMDIETTGQYGVEIVRYFGAELHIWDEVVASRWVEKFACIYASFSMKPCRQEYMEDGILFQKPYSDSPPHITNYFEVSKPHVVNAYNRLWSIAERYVDCYA